LHFQSKALINVTLYFFILVGVEMSHLFEPYRLKDVTLRNRIGVSPMCQYCYTDGLADDWTLVHLGARATGGAGLVLSEATAVSAEGRITPNDLGIWSEAHVEPLARVTRYLKSQGAVAGIQLAHAGRKASTHRPWEGGKPLTSDDPRCWPVVGASPIAFAEGYQVPHGLSQAEIKHIEEQFVEAAQRSLEAGFEWAEIHAAHGYLLHSFLSPLSNTRTDEYGGSFTNRIRFLVETVQAVRRVWPERLPLTVRVSGTEWVEHGWQVEDTVELARVLKKEGVDLLDCSSGGNIPHAPIPQTPGYQVAVRRQTGLATAAVGLITEAHQADEIIRQGQADLILMAREFLRDPYWPIRAAKILGQEPPTPPQYQRAF
jgi:2,4-dienoyl-CoA reductase-like NADH-dependent reductase (Old Yellow Enzyme family)